MNDASHRSRAGGTRRSAKFGFAALPTHTAIVLFLLAACAVLAGRAVLDDSITWDETSHLTSGYTYLRTGDFRLAPDHPPLAKMWAALPLLAMSGTDPPPDTPGWREGNMWAVGRAWLFVLNDGDRFITPARCMMVVLLLATCLCVYAAARRCLGKSSGLLAMALAAVCPNFLAHGHLVTTDLPATFAATLSLWTFARLLEKVTWARLAGAAAALAVFSLVKFSWVLVLPVLPAMALVGILRPAPLRLSLRPLGAGAEGATVVVASRLARAMTLAAIALVLMVFVWLAIWACFGFRYSPFRGADRHVATMFPGNNPGPPQLATMEDVWLTVLPCGAEAARPGPVVRGLLWARRHRLLPEAYLYGLAYTLHTTESRPAYLMGETGDAGWWSYFPIAFAIKTPVATLALMVAGAVALMTRAAVIRDPVLAAGLATFAVVWWLSAVSSHINIGHRHLLPAYPCLFVAAGATAAWWNRRAGRILIALAVGWLFTATVRIHPHYIAYFNELIGGPENGHRYLADSNIDWGQDLKRLARYAREHPTERLKLAYFGSAMPQAYGLRCEMLPSFEPFAEARAKLDAGTYVVSVTQMLGVYEPTARRAYWADASNRATYAALWELFASSATARSPALDERRLAELADRFETMRHGRLLHRLSERTPDGRIGYSLLVHRLSRDEIARLVAP